MIRVFFARAFVGGVAAGLLATGAVVAPRAEALTTGPRPAFVTAWGQPGTAAGQFNEASDVALAPDGSVVVADQGNSRVQVFETDGTLVRSWGAAGRDPGEFEGNNGVAVDDDGNVYVADTFNQRIQTFTATGVPSAQWGEWGRAPGQFIAPLSVAVDDAQQVYVVDSNNHRIQKFSSSGAYLGQWGSAGSGPGEFSYPSDVAVDNAGVVYVADTFNHRVQAFTDSGTFVAQWGTQGSAAGQFQLPRGIAVAGDDVYVSDTGNNRLQRFASDGTLVSTWGSTGSGGGQFRQPLGLAADAAGRVVVADAWNNRIASFAPGPRPDGRVRRSVSRPFKGNDLYQPDGVGQTAGAHVQPGAAQRYRVSLQNDVADPDVLRVVGGGPTESFRVRYEVEGTDVTGLVTAGTFTTSALEPDAALVLTVEVTARRRAVPGARAAIDVTVASATASARSDTIRLVTIRW